MKRYLNQLECKILRAGDSLFNSTTTDNLLIFVFSGKLIIYSQEGTHIAEVAKDHFMLLAQNTNHKVIASAPTRLILIHAGSLSDMIIKPGMECGETGRITDSPSLSAHIKSDRILYEG